LNARLFGLRLFWAVFGLIGAVAIPLAAQTDPNSYQGPGVLSSGISDIGSRSGQQVDLRFWGGVTGVYDTNLQPLTTDAHGNLIHVGQLFGVAANAGAYGAHHWQHAQLAINYTGDYRYYPENQTYDGTDQALTLGMTVQYSSRIVLDLKVAGATLSQGTGAVANVAAAGGSVPAAQLFDSRSSYVDVTGMMTVLQSARTSYSFGGGASGYYYDESGLSDSSGYHATGSMNHRISLSTAIGAIYTYSKINATGGSFSSQTQTAAGQYFGNFGRFWSLNVTAGITISQVHQLVAVQLDPLLANIFGVPSVVLPFDTRTLYPSGKAALTRQFQRASLNISYERSVGAGNGFYLSTRNETAGGGISYTGIQKWNFGIDGSYRSSVNLGQVAGVVTSYGAGAGATYSIGRFTHISARFDVNHYDFGATSAYNRTAQRGTIGILFSPGNIPLSLW
jgi:hypothetical protein